MIRSSQRARELLKSVFGYDDFRPGQEEVIAAVLAGEPVLAIMPTGSGKSMCYQLPALVEESLTLVVSPLIALMRDQVQQMRTLGIAAATLNSMNSDDETRETWSLLRNGLLRILFVSPERLMVDGLIPHLQRAGVTRVAIDEAHCISEWGHDFRPEYRQLRAAVEALGGVQVVALTATADRATQGDIVERLFKTLPKVFVHSFDRPNLHLRFMPKEKPRVQLGDFLDRHRGQSGIVYCASRKRTEDLALYFQGKGFEAIPYHAGLDQAVRHRHQDRFLQEDGVVAVATVAFGMGINKPDVRFVAHADMPASVEAYYQEIGRAGRDGLPADTLTLYGLDDMALRRRQIDEKQLDDGRRRIEHRRLSSMTMLCEATACRRQMLLSHFGENSGPCGTCDMCQGKVMTYDGTLDAQKVLSAIWRTGQRFGSDYLVHLLIGAPTEQMQRNGHDQLKTFGVGRDKTKAQWTSIIRQLFANGALETASEEFGGFRIGPKGDAILRGGETVALRDVKETVRQKAKEAAKRAAPAAEIDAATAEVLAGLKKLRREIAREEGVAAFMIFADRTLIDMAEKRPATLDDMRQVYGVGERKLTQYGEAFLHALAEL
ncbi:DNA helicase RecQ [Methylovirgula sp. 4M-Z18]|uniref:DNA helicase RecQ n=1 Tax=Methylovirgula sp. 4M-Z18 TaxID=2293567 RepID=UPI000E2E962B|nr:DNA helicase RecQ [Methylovirgula sp. 4M-Z18]RFB81601.1 DNA helicase RecQ [Methylovirgula sp. 4M-Z18]